MDTEPGSTMTSATVTGIAAAGKAAPRNTMANATVANVARWNGTNGAYELDYVNAANPSGVVADTIGISRADLRDALKSGQTIRQVATDHGVDPQAVVDAALAALNGRVDEAVANGRISAERGDTIKGKAAERAPQLLDHVFGQHAGA